MLHLVETDRPYPPETVAIMTAAFDRVCQSLSTGIKCNQSVQELLALLILRHVDFGERDSARLADVALRELTGKDDLEIGDRAATG